MRNIAKYFWMTWFAIRAETAYARELAARTLFVAVILFVFSRIWSLVYRSSGTDQLAGLSLVEMLWYLGVGQALVMSAPTSTEDIDDDVRTGRVGVLLVRPVTYAGLRLSEAIGSRIVRLSVHLVAVTLVMAVIVGPGGPTLRGIALFTLALPMVFVLDALGFLLVGFLSFWLDSTTGVWLMYRRVVLMLGGLLIPLDLLPEWFRRLCHVLPFETMIYGPARLFVSGRPDLLRELWMRQLAAVLVLGLAVWCVERRALRRIATHGG